MTMLGIGLIVFTICFSLLIIIVLPFLKAKNYSYYIYLGINLAWLIYFLATRWGPYIKNLIDSGGIEYLKNNWSFFNPADYSVYVSKALLLDMCPFLALVLPITIIFDKKMVFAKNVGVLAAFGGLITIFGGMYNQTLDPNESLGNFIFLGTNLNKIYFMMHFYLLTMGLSTILTNKSYRWNDVLTSHVVAVSYLIYVYILVKYLNLTNNVTGLAYGDWLGVKNYIGEYATVFTFFIKYFNKNLEWFQVMWISYFLVWLTVVIIMILKNVLVRSDDKKIKFWSYQVIYNSLKKSKHFLLYKVKNYLLLKPCKISNI